MAGMAQPVQPQQLVRTVRKDMFISVIEREKFDKACVLLDCVRGEKALEVLRKYVDDELAKMIVDLAKREDAYVIITTCDKCYQWIQHCGENRNYVWIWYPIYGEVAAICDVAGWGPTCFEPLWVWARNVWMSSTTKYYCYVIPLTPVAVVVQYEHEWYDGGCGCTRIIDPPWERKYTIIYVLVRDEKTATLLKDLGLSELQA